MAKQSDFVEIQLSADGLAMAGPGGALCITTQHFSYAFKPGTTVRVLTSEWSRTLSREQSNGRPIFEVAPASAAQGATAVAALETLKVQDTAIEAQIAQETNTVSEGGK
jgi:hypothetical protein